VINYDQYHNSFITLLKMINIGTFNSPVALNQGKNVKRRPLFLIDVMDTILEVSED